MEEEDPVLQEMRSWTGKELVPQPAKFEVEKGMMMKIPWVINDPNPLWRNEKYARQTRYGGIIASPSFVEYLRIRPACVPDRKPTPVTRLGIPGTRGQANVVGGEEVEYFRPIRPGDVINISHKNIGVKKSWSKSLGTQVYILTFEFTYTNQFDELVALHRTTSFKI